MKVSVIIPVYNAAPFLDKSIQSALNQSQTQEVLLIDDRSTDDSLNICNAWADKDARVRVFCNMGPKGSGAARNVGLGKATCDYIAFLDADDYYLEGRFEGDEKIFNTNQSVDAVINHIIFSTIKNEIICHNHYIDGALMGPKHLYTPITHNTNFGNQNGSIIATTLKKDVVLKVGLFDETLKQAQDTDFLFRVILHTNVYSGLHKKPVAVYFRHDTNTTLHMPSAVYYRRAAAKKHFHLSRKQHLPLQLQRKLLLKFMEYDFIWLFKGDYWWKKIVKFVLLPYFIYRLFSDKDPEYDSNRKINVFSN